mgnify:FL=1
MYIGKKPQIGNYQTCDSISATATDTFNLLVGGVAVSPISAHHCLVSLNGILQAPISSYTIVGSTIVFASALTTSDSIDFITILGSTLDTGTPSDGTVTNAKLAQDIISGETALTVSPATTDEVLISDAGTLKRADISVLGNTPAFMVVMGSDDTIANSTFTKATFDTEVFDTNSAFASNKFTVPANEGGKYIFFAHIYVTSVDDTNRVEGRIYKNGSDAGGASTGSSTVRWYSVGSNLDMDMGFSWIGDLAAADYIELYVQQTNGDSQTLYRTTWLAGYKLIGV